MRRAKRSWPAQYKLDILNEIEAAKDSGETTVQEICRREGLYSSLIAEWRKQRDAGALEGLSDRKAGRPKKDPAKAELARLSERVASSRTSCPQPTSSSRRREKSRRSCRRCSARAPTGTTTSHERPDRPVGATDRGGPGVPGVRGVGAQLQPPPPGRQGRVAPRPSRAKPAEQHCRVRGRSPPQNAMRSAMFCVHRVWGPGPGPGVRHVAGRGPLPVFGTDDVPDPARRTLSGNDDAGTAAPVMPRPGCMLRPRIRRGRGTSPGSVARSCGPGSTCTSCWTSSAAKSWPGASTPSSPTTSPNDSSNGLAPGKASTPTRSSCTPTGARK